MRVNLRWRPRLKRRMILVAPGDSAGGRDDRQMLAIAEPRAKPKAECFYRPYGTDLPFASFPSTSYWATFTESLRDKSPHRTILALKLTRMGGCRIAAKSTAFPNLNPRARQSVATAACRSAGRAGAQPYRERTVTKTGIRRRVREPETKWPVDPAPDIRRFFLHSSESRFFPRHETVRIRD
jgi:hypothetical protein